MKIAVVYQYIYPQHFGGGEKRLFEVFSQFPECAEIHWYAQYHANYDNYPGLKRFKIESFEDEKDSDSRRSIVEIWNYCFFLLKSLDLTKYDVVHIGQMPFFHILAVLIKSRFTPNSAIISIDWWEYWGKYWFDKHDKVSGIIGRITEFLILKLATNLVVISPKTKRDVESKTFANITLIHNGVDLKKIDAAVNVQKKYDVIIFGRVEEWKGPLMGVQVFQKMLEIDPNLQMLIVGSGSYKAILESYVRSQHLENNINFHGRAEDHEIFSLIKSAKMMFLFSKQEGGGSITLFEGNACGLPVATAYFENGIDHEIVTQENGFFFNNQPLEVIATELLNTLKDEAKLTELSRSSAKFVEKYDWQVISRQYYELFEKVIKDSK
jgi:glycosyltransferase involved in cell wall biosynthesis